MRTIAIVNQKGGCGKTTTSINLSAFLALQGKKVLVVDMDPQGHATLGLSAESAPPTRTMYDLFNQKPDRRALALPDIVRTVRENLDLAPSDILLSAVPERLRGMSGREDVLQRAFAEIDGQYDYVIVDCAPNVGLLTFNAVKGCSEAIVPMDPSFFSLHGIAKVFEMFDLLSKETGHHVSPRVVVTLYYGRTPYVKAVLEEIRNHLRGQYFQTVIRYSVKLGEASSHGLPIAHYCRHCAGYEDYKALASEVLQQEAPKFSNQEVGETSEIGAGAITISAVTGPIFTKEGVVFTLEAPGAEQVQLVGDFNGWIPQGSEMEPMGRLWRKHVKLQPGRYQYGFIVDGQWQVDPCTGTEPGPFGGQNSVLVFDPAPAEAAWN